MSSETQEQVQKKATPQQGTERDEIVLGDDAISDYLERLENGRLTEAELRVGVPRHTELGDWEEDRRAARMGCLGKDECPDENLPND